VLREAGVLEAGVRGQEWEQERQHKHELGCLIPKYPFYMRLPLPCRYYTFVLIVLLSPIPNNVQINVVWLMNCDVVVVSGARASRFTCALLSSINLRSLLAPPQTSKSSLKSLANSSSSGIASSYLTLEVRISH